MLESYFQHIRRGLTTLTGLSLVLYGDHVRQVMFQYLNDSGISTDSDSSDNE